MSKASFTLTSEANTPAAISIQLFRAMEMELLDQSVLPTIKRGKTAVFDYIEVFYNRQRRHSYINYVSYCGASPLTLPVARIQPNYFRCFTIRIGYLRDPM